MSNRTLFSTFSFFLPIKGPFLIFFLRLSLFKFTDILYSFSLLHEKCSGHMTHVQFLTCFLFFMVKMDCPSNTYCINYNCDLNMKYITKKAWNFNMLRKALEQLFGYVFRNFCEAYREHKNEMVIIFLCNLMTISGYYLDRLDK